MSQQIQRRRENSSITSNQQPRILKTSTPYKNGEKVFDSRSKKDFKDINTFKSIREDMLTNYDPFQEVSPLRTGHTQSNKQESKFNTRYKQQSERDEQIDNNSLLVNDIETLGNMTFQQKK